MPRKQDIFRKKYSKTRKYIFRIIILMLINLRKIIKDLKQNITIFKTFKNHCKAG